MRFLSEAELNLVAGGEGYRPDPEGTHQEVNQFGETITVSNSTPNPT